MIALIVRDPWATQIVQGKKTKEYRTRPTNIRGRIGIIKAGTKTIIGEVDLVDCRGSYDDGLDFFIWILKNPIEYSVPKPYKHPRGAQTWVYV